MITEFTVNSFRFGRTVTKNNRLAFLLDSLVSLPYFTEEKNGVLFVAVFDRQNLVF